jgi:hypothetical protein
MRQILLSFALFVSVARAETRTISLEGTVTNTTANLTAPAQLELTQDGEKISARLVTSPPLTGTGNMTGRIVDGWCELSGDFGEGFALRFTGVINPHAFRGTYVVIPKQGLTQYGRFDFTEMAAKR